MLFKNCKGMFNFYSAIILSNYEINYNSSEISEFSVFTVFQVLVAALTFFTGSDNDKEKDSDDSDSENEINPREVMMANKVNKKTKKREKQLEKVKKLIKKKKKKEKAPVFNFSALHLIHDPQGFAERLFKRLEATNERFEIKLLILDVISRLIGLHQLILFNFYPYIQRYLQPHQRGTYSRIKLFFRYYVTLSMTIFFRIVSSSQIYSGYNDIFLCMGNGGDLYSFVPLRIFQRLPRCYCSSPRRPTNSSRRR